MLERVFQKTLFQAKLLIAKIARKGFLICVGADMALYRIGVPELFIAILARVGLFSTVQTHMWPITFGICKCSSAFLTANRSHIFVNDCLIIIDCVSTHHLYGCSPVCVLIWSRKLLYKIKYFFLLKIWIKVSEIIQIIFTVAVRISSGRQGRDIVIPQCAFAYAPNVWPEKEGFTWALEYFFFLELCLPFEQTFCHKQSIDTVFRRYVSCKRIKCNENCIRTWNQLWIRPHVCLKSALVMKLPIAAVAFERIITGVLSRVIIEGFRVDEGCITVFALVRSVTCMFAATTQSMLFKMRNQRKQESELTAYGL